MSREIVSRRGRRGFTLLQLLAVIAVVTVLSAIAFPAFVGPDGPVSGPPRLTWEQERMAMETTRWHGTAGFMRYEQHRAARLHQPRGGVK